EGARLRAAVRARPEEVVLHGALGKLLERGQPPRWARAVECYTAARALRPELGEALAFALTKSGRGDEGLALDDRLVADRPDSPWLHFRRGIVLAAQGRFEEAEAAFRKALGLIPDLPEVHSNLGFTLNAQGRFKEAEAAFREALHLNKDLASAHNGLGTVLCDGLARYQEAEAEFRYAINLRLLADLVGVR